MILVGDALSKLAELPEQSVDCVVTSPPYWGLRDYGSAGQLGLEETPEQYVGHLRMIFEQVWRVLKSSGTLWLNIGDSYAGRGHGGGGSFMKMRSGGAWGPQSVKKGWRSAPKGLRNKDLVGIPWKVAFALQADGWTLRQDIVWHKPNPMPESVRDRCTKAHEYIFLFAKNKKYFFNSDALKEPATKAPTKRGIMRGPGNWGVKKIGLPGESSSRGRSSGPVSNSAFRNKRSVWTVNTGSFKGAHFATFPEKLIEPCILAGCPVGGTVLDPFFGAGTTGVVAKKQGRKYIGIELNPAYAEIAEKRIGAIAQG